MTNEKSINRSVVSGVIRRKSDLRLTQNESKFCTFTVMVMEGGREGEQKRQFIDCVAWRGQADRVAAWPVGSKVYVSGRLQSLSWLADDSTKRFKTEIVCETVELVASLQSRPDSAITSQNPIGDHDIPF